MSGEKVKKLSHLARGEIQFDSMSRQGDNRATVYLQFMHIFLSLERGMRLSRRRTLSHLEADCRTYRREEIQS